MANIFCAHFEYDRKHHFADPFITEKSTSKTVSKDTKAAVISSLPNGN